MTIYVPAEEPEDWRRLLGDPIKHWRPGFSAWCLAHAWQSADGFPDAIRRALDTTGADGLGPIVMLAGFPEHKTGLPGRGRPSQSDLLVVAHSRRGLVAMTVEGKVDEPFGPLVNEWLDAGRADNQNKVARLDGLCDLLEMSVDQVGGLRYQLLHRTAAALLEAKRFGAPDAVMLVHSFSPGHNWFEDFTAFVLMMGGVAAAGRLIGMGLRAGIELHLAWVSDVCASDH